VLLILLVIAFPAVEMVRSSFLRITQTGLATGGNGLGNYQRLLREPALPGVVWHTIVWVGLVVGVTVLVSLPLAQFLDKSFAGRRLVRLALLVPWAASLVMTATIWRYIYEGAYGPLNRVLMDLGLLDQPVEWYKDTRFAFWGLIVIGIVVSIPVHDLRVPRRAADHPRRAVRGGQDRRGGARAVLPGALRRHAPRRAPERPGPVQHPRPLPAGAVGVVQLRRGLEPDPAAGLPAGDPRHRRDHHAHRAGRLAAGRLVRGRNLFLYMILATQMFAPVALVVGLYREYALVDNLFANLGLGLRATYSYWAIILVYSAFNLAFAV